jgi:radical SAM superfamily enzyme YgiQ (UPF0313 family)
VFIRRLTLVSALSALDSALAGGNGNLAPPLGVLTLAAILRPHFDIRLLDLDYLWWKCDSGRDAFQERARAAIVETEPDFLGFSTISGSYPATIRLAEACSHELPNTPIIFGGPQASVVDSATLRAFSFISFIVRGEADETFPQLLDALERDSHPGLLPGITFRSGNSIVRNPNAPPIADLDASPLPAFDLLDYDLRNRGLPIEAGRGCPFSCTFCSTNDFFRRKFRLRSPQCILENMRTLNARYGTKRFVLTHDMFTVDRKRVVEFCETMIDAGSPFEWSCSARTDCVDRELLQLMRKAGCADIFFGIETGSQRMQHVIQKDLDMQVAREVFHETYSMGFHSTASIIVGYPEETPEDLRESVRFYGDMLRFPTVEPQFNILSPLAGTPLTDQYRDVLYLDAEWETISESGRGQDDSDRALIALHPQIFQSFYALPSQTPRAVLRRLRDFLYAGGTRCGTLLYALHLHAGNLFDVFQRWEEAAGPQTQAWFHSIPFVRNLVDFADKEYGERDLAVHIAAGFYRKVFETSETSAAGSAQSLRLAENVRLIDCDGDIHALLRAFRTSGNRPNDSELLRPVTALVRHFHNSNGSEISEFPYTTTELLRHAKCGSAPAQIVTDFERRNISVSGFSAEQVVLTGITMLENKGLLRSPT